jgi:hypothetical protein
MKQTLNALFLNHFTDMGIAVDLRIVHNDEGVLGREGVHLSQ